MTVTVDWVSPDDPHPGRSSTAPASAVTPIDLLSIRSPYAAGSLVGRGQPGLLQRDLAALEFLQFGVEF
ncbi:hypothetical protein ABQF26_26615, partial [Mycolicibacterium elephantis]